RPRPDPGGFCRDLERQCRRGAGRHDPDPARLRAELEGDQDLRRDAAAPRAALIHTRSSPMKRLPLIALPLPLAACETLNPRPPVDVAQPTAMRPPVVAAPV